MGRPIGFLGTGSAVVDNILEEVELAAQRYHDVNRWDEPNVHLDGAANLDCIQRAAEKAAKRIAELEAENARLKTPECVMAECERLLRSLVDSGRGVDVVFWEDGFCGIDARRGPTLNAPSLAEAFGKVRDGGGNV